MNYQKELEKIIENIKNTGDTPRLFLHSCCAPCSSYVLEYLSEYFEITVYFYNPNIFPEQEYSKRVEEQGRFIDELKVKNKIKLIEAEYDNNEFESMIKGLENEKEGGPRCFRCYELRLQKTIDVAEKMGYDYFTTTLSISPHKNAKKINEIGERIADGRNIKWLYSDFKKNNGYKKSIELSKKHDLYRQDYCGCIYSKKKEEKLER